jgi:RNA polymerase sigma factor (sigma-70 family)
MTDEELVRRYVAERDPADVRELVERHAPRVLRLVASVLGPYRQGDIEEAVQDVFVRVHQKLDSFHGSAAFATWLTRSARSMASFYGRQKVLCRERREIPPLSL